MSGIVTLSLPYPPSANRLWRNVGRKTLKSEEYRIWERDALTSIMTQRRSRFDGPYTLRIEIGRPDNRARDIDNLIKPLNDILATAGVVRNDADTQRVEASWVSGLVGVRVTIAETTRVAA